MLHALLAAVWAVASHPQSMAAGLVVGYLCPGSVSQAIAWVKSKL